MQTLSTSPFSTKIVSYLFNESNKKPYGDAKKPIFQLLTVNKEA